MMNSFAETTAGRVLVIATFVFILLCSAVLAFALGGLRADVNRSAEALETIKESLSRVEGSRQEIVSTIVVNQNEATKKYDLILKRLDALEK